MYILVLQRLFLEFLIDFLYFPLWWYTGGIKHAGLFCIHLVQWVNSYLAPGLWLKNIFVPMFGQSDWQGRITSFFMRSVNVVGRSIGLLLWVLIVLALFVVWLALPLFVIYMLFVSLI